LTTNQGVGGSNPPRCATITLIFKEFNKLVSGYFR